MQPESALPVFDIVVVDDEPPICDLLARMGKKVFPEANFINIRSAQETLDYLDERQANPPQLILLDINLGQATDGLDVLPQLRTRFEGRVPIIMLSMIAEDAKVEQAYDKGAVAYTQKPDDKAGWEQYVVTLRDHWYRSARLPTIPPLFD